MLGALNGELVWFQTFIWGSCPQCLTWSCSLDAQNGANRGCFLNIPPNAAVTACSAPLPHHRPNDADGLLPNSWLMDNYAYLKGQNKHKWKFFSSTGYQEHFQPYTFTSPGLSLLNWNSMLFPRIQLTGRDTAYEQLTSLVGGGNYSNHMANSKHILHYFSKNKNEHRQPHCSITPNSSTLVHLDTCNRSTGAVLHHTCLYVLVFYGCCNKLPSC